MLLGQSPLSFQKVHYSILWSHLLFHHIHGKTLKILLEIKRLQFRYLLCSMAWWTSTKFIEMKALRSKVAYPVGYFPDCVLKHQSSLIWTIHIQFSSTLKWDQSILSNEDKVSFSRKITQTNCHSRGSNACLISNPSISGPTR